MDDQKNNVTIAPSVDFRFRIPDGEALVLPFMTWRLEEDRDLLRERRFEPCEVRDGLLRLHCMLEA